MFIQFRCDYVSCIVHSPTSHIGISGCPRQDWLKSAAAPKPILTKASAIGIRLWRSTEDGVNGEVRNVPPTRSPAAARGAAPAPPSGASSLASLGAVISSEMLDTLFPTVLYLTNCSGLAGLNFESRNMYQCQVTLVNYIWST